MFTSDDFVRIKVRDYDLMHGTNFNQALDINVTSFYAHIFNYADENNLEFVQILTANISAWIIFRKKEQR